MIIASNPSYTNFEIRTENGYKFLTFTAGSLSTSPHDAYVLFDDSGTIYYIRISIMAGYSFDFNEITSILDTATLIAVK